MANIKFTLSDKPNKNGLFRVRLRITKDRKNKYVSLKYLCLKKDWNTKESEFKKSYPNYQQRNKALRNLEEKAYSIIEEFEINEEDFSLEQFIGKFKNKDSKNITVLEFWNMKIDEMNRLGRTGNARAYQNTKSSFFKFCTIKNLLFREITVDMLTKYELFLRENGNKDGGVGVKMRELRAIYNDAIKRGVVKKKYYPFKTFKVSKFKGISVKKALTREEVRLIESLDEDQFPMLVEAKDFFMFSFYTSGMNFYDLMKLKWENIEDNRIMYSRSKTKGRFSIKILEPVRAILDKYEAIYPDTPFVFPILLKEGLTPIQIENRKAKKLKKYNADLKNIAKVLGIKKIITSYVARHTYATTLKFKGISTDIISQGMGHKNINITNAYLKQFDDDVLDKANEKLLEPIPVYEFA